MPLTCDFSGHLKSQPFILICVLFFKTGAAPISQPQMLSKYRTGFNECATEVMKYLNTSPANNPTIKTKLMGHLSSCVQKVNTAPSLPPQYHHATTASASFTPSAVHHQQQPHQGLPSATQLCSLPGRAATPSGSRLSSFTPVRKSPTLGIEAPCLDCSSSIPSTSHLPSTSSLSPSGIELRMMNGFMPLASAPSGGPSTSGHSSLSHSAASPSRPSSEPAYFAALDIEEIRNKFGDVWRPW